MHALRSRVVLVLLMAVLILPVCASADSPRIARDLLLQYEAEMNCSADCSYDALSKIRALKPVQEVLALYERHDSSVYHLGGLRLGDVCEAMGPNSCVSTLIRGLDNSDAGWRALSCEALEILEPPEAIPKLLELLRDQTLVRLACTDPTMTSSYIGDPSVAVFAASALAMIGRRDGVSLLLEHASRVKMIVEEDPASEFLPPTILPHVNAFRQLSGQDIGNDLDDLDAWKRWFAQDE